MHLNTAARLTLAALAWAVTAVLATAAPASMVESGPSRPPIGAYEFCNAQPSECKSETGDPGPLTLDQERWQTLVRINYQVNSTITPRTDEEVYGVEERWAYPKTAGDCEDFALLKRKLLIEAGFSPADLLMTVVLLPNGEGHAVLTIRTDRGDFVLDELRNKILLWSNTEYTYLKRQSSGDASRWMKLQDGRASIVGSVR
jgi:predicted transglutaminase-like cysteine proteinase